MVSSCCLVVDTAVLADESQFISPAPDLWTYQMLLHLLLLKLPLTLLLKLPCIQAFADKLINPAGTGAIPSLPEPDPRADLNLVRDVNIDLPNLPAPDWNELTTAWLKRFVLCALVTKISSTMAMTYKTLKSRGKALKVPMPVGLAKLVVSKK